MRVLRPRHGWDEQEYGRLYTRTSADALVLQIPLRRKPGMVNHRVLPKLSPSEQNNDARQMAEVVFATPPLKERARDDRHSSPERNMEASYCYMGSILPECMKIRVPKEIKFLYSFSLPHQHFVCKGSVGTC